MRAWCFFCGFVVVAYLLVMVGGIFSPQKSASVVCWPLLRSAAAAAVVVGG